MLYPYNSNNPSINNLTHPHVAAQDRVSEFELKLMDISSENLGIPETEYAASVRMPSGEFQRICRDLSTIGDTVEMSVTKDGIRFATVGDIGNASVICRQNTAVDRVWTMKMHCWFVDLLREHGWSFPELSCLVILCWMRSQIRIASSLL